MESAKMQKRQGCYKAEVLAVKNLLYGVSYAPENNEKIYYFLLVDADKEHAFKEALKGNQPFNVRDYGTVVESGHGEPPEALKEQIRIKYNAIL